MEIDSNNVKYTYGLLAKLLAKKIAIGAGGIAGINAISDQVAVEKYLKEHPKTKLSRQEILELTRG